MKCRMTVPGLFVKPLLLMSAVVLAVNAVTNRSFRAFPPFG